MTGTTTGRPTLVASREQLERTASPLSGLGPRWLLVALAPVALTLLVVTAGYVAAGGADPGFPPQFPTLVYGVANLAVVGALAARLDREAWRAVALFGRPTRRELAGVAGATAVGILVGWPASTLVADWLGLSAYGVPALSSTFAVAALFVGSVVVAPVTEELLFRGLFVGVVIERGHGVAAAAASSLAVFAAMHVFTAGPGGVVNAALLGAVLTWLRFRYDSLVGAWLCHAAINGLEFLVALSVVPSLYAV